MARTGHYAILEQLAADGIRQIFGNPGTVKQGFLDALGDFPDFRYILTLQESRSCLRHPISGADTVIIQRSRALSTEVG